MFTTKPFRIGDCAYYGYERGLLGTPPQSVDRVNAKQTLRFIQFRAGLLVLMTDEDGINQMLAPVGRMLPTQQLFVSAPRADAMLVTNEVMEAIYRQLVALVGKD